MSNFALVNFVVANLEINFDFFILYFFKFHFYKFFVKKKKICTLYTQIKIVFFKLINQK